jgi:hypothetical protein
MAIALMAVSSGSAGANEARSLDEVRNTVIYLLEALVQKGVMTREQAEQMVADAQGKAERDARVRAEKDADAGEAVRVTYVPQVVRDEISAQVSSEIRPKVVEDVVAQARAEEWGVPAALPDWIKGMRVSGDVRVRQQWDLYSSDNAEFAYLDFLRVNQRGGIGLAGDDAFLNTTEDRSRLRVRARLGFEADLGDDFSAGLRLATGNFTDPVSTNTTLAQNDGRMSFGVDQAYVRYEPGSSPGWAWLTVWGGRAENPFLSTDLLFDTDVTFEGISGTYRYGLSDLEPAGRHAFLTIGAFPIEEVELSSDDKWLYSAQLGSIWTLENDVRLRGALAYHYYDNITGIRNALNSNVYDYTAPAWLQKGNTLFDIRNDVDPATNLFALAAEYHLLNVLAGVDVPLSTGHHLTFLADYVDNLGFDRRDVLARTGIDVEARTTGYQFEVGFGHPSIDRLNAWRAAIRYRYLERDAVLDGLTDSDFHLGGTDAKGFVLRADYGIARRVYLTMRYLSANEIDGPPLAIDVVQLDVTGRF